MKINKLKLKISEEKNNHNKKIIIFMSIWLFLFRIIIILLLAILGAIYPFPNTFRTEFEGNFTLKEQIQINYIFDEIKPEFKEYQRKIRIVKDISPYCKEADIPGCAGLNYETRDLIIVEYSRDIEQFKFVLCHELIHTYVSLGNEEEIVQELSDSLPCYIERFKY